MKDLANIKHISSLSMMTIVGQWQCSRWMLDCACKQQYRIVLIVALFLPQLCIASPSKITDLRIVIDVSGSMKQNDPNNLRVPALKLLVGLMPDDTLAGVWTFGKFVNMQVKHGRVNAGWRKSARKEASQIHSRGLFTNIEQALKSATHNWKSVNGKYSRHLILLTDGMVDISKNQKLNKSSRERILTQLLPRLKKTGVKIHTIALSDQADHELLKTLSVTTDGWYELIEEPDKLHRVFLRLFEKSTPSNSLPLKGNVFKVDKSITDMTVLSFAKNKKPTRLISPKGKIYTQKVKTNNINWFHEKEYDLITIKNPQQGEWRLDAPLDKDNRVMVVTNLSLKVDELPNNTLLNESVSITAQLQQKNKIITRKRFLKLINMEVKREALDIPVMIKKLQDNGEHVDVKANDGIYQAVIKSTLKPGTYEVTVSAQGPTFERQYKHLINVFDGLASLDVQSGENTEPYKISISPHKGLLIPESIVILQQLDNGKTKKIKQNKENLWEFEIPANKQEKMVSVIIKGMRQNNKTIEMQMQKMLPERIDKKNTQVSKEKKSSKKAKKKIEIKPEQKKSSWLKILMWVILINVIIFSLAVTGYLLIKKIRTKKLTLEQAELNL